MDRFFICGFICWPLRLLSPVYVFKEAILSPLALSLFAFAMIGFGLSQLSNARDSYVSHQVWLEGERTEGLMSGSTTDYLFGVFTTYVVEVQYTDKQGKAHVGRETFTHFLNGAFEREPPTLRVSPTNPEFFATSEVEASWFSSMLIDGLLGVGLVAFFAFILLLCARLVSEGLAELNHLRQGKWVAVPRTLSEGSPDFVWVNQQADRVLGIEYLGKVGTARMVIGAEGAPFIMSAAQIEQAVTLARTDQ